MKTLSALENNSPAKRNPPMSTEDKELLEDDGWIVECESPFAIRNQFDPESRATGLAARMILDYLKQG